MNNTDRLVRNAIKDDVRCLWHHSVRDTFGHGGYKDQGDAILSVIRFVDMAMAGCPVPVGAIVYYKHGGGHTMGTVMDSALYPCDDTGWEWVLKMDKQTEGFDGDTNDCWLGYRLYCDEDMKWEMKEEETE